MKLSEIKPGRWYATRIGTGECISVGVEPRFRIDGVERYVVARDVYGEAKKPEEVKQ